MVTNTQEQGQVRAAWDAIARGYDQYVTEPGMPLAEDALQRAGLQKGMRVLDVASGSGAVSIPAARLGAEVTAVDLSSAMVEHLKARASTEGLTNLEAHVMDGHRLQFEDGTFDIAASQFGVMLFPDLPRALSEMTRVVRPGGKVVMIAYAAPSEIEFLGLFIGAMKTVVPDFTGLPADRPPLPFQVADPDVLRQRMTEAGLKDVRVEQGAEVLKIRSGKELWDWVVNSNPIPVMLVADLTEDQKADVRQTLDREIRKRTTALGYANVTNPVNIAIGTK